MDRWTAWSPAFLLAALAALTFWLDAQVQAPEGPRNGDLRHDPDTFITNFRATSFDEAGRVKQSLKAQRAEHHPDDDSVDFVVPELTLTDPARPKLSVHSDVGTLSGDREKMFFRGHVNARREAMPDAKDVEAGGALTLTTDFLRVLPEKGVADTDRPVTIEEGRGIIHGVGITLDNQTRTVRMKSSVRGSFQPDSPK
ncbi:MAG: LPS export ABC transporter periplasmic protein LptC [Pseudomonadota bacterium]|nr:LPS export ABC transporter periplasmic protein LptC [Pseudomonadota bacterium]